MHRTARTTSRTATAVAAAAALLTGPLAALASAHVTVQGPGATQGGFTKLTFRVPTEKDVPTTKIEIAMPEDTPIPSLRVMPKPGWTYEMTKAAPKVPVEAHGEPVTEVVTRITWTVAAGNKGIGATEFDEFDVSAGPLPKTEELTFKALQSYADGEVVRWIEEPVEGGEEPEKPAPRLQLAAAEADGDDDGAASASSSTDLDAEAASASDTGTDGLTIGTAIVAALALATGLAALLRGRRAG